MKVKEKWSEFSDHFLPLIIKHLREGFPERESALPDIFQLLGPQNANPGESGPNPTELWVEPPRFLVRLLPAVGWSPGPSVSTWLVGASSLEAP